MLPLARSIARRVQTVVLAGAVLLVLGSAAFAESIAPLVSPAWLKERLGTPNLVVLDIRSAIDGGGAEAYQQGHVPGAIHSDYDKGGWRVTKNGVPFMTPNAVELEKLIGELGIDEDSHVVVVPAGVHATDFGSATRVYWTLKLAGLSKLSILDGGFAAWKAAGMPVESKPNKPSPTILTVNLDKRVLAELGYVQALQKTAASTPAGARAERISVTTKASASEAQQQPNATLLDARDASFFMGKVKAPAAQAYGHIPGATNIDHALLYDSRTNRLRAKAELAATLASVPDGPVVSYCNTGHWASINWFVLSELLGRKDVRLYAGSMVEWTADASRPVESARTKWDDLLKVLGLGS